MAQLSLLELGSKVPPSLLQAIQSPFYGADGGNVKSPIWFCALEPGKGYSPEKPCRPEDFYGRHDETKLYLKKVPNATSINEALIDENDTSVVSGSPIVHQVFVLLLAAIIEGKLGCTKLFGRKVEGACIRRL